MPNIPPKDNPIPNMIGQYGSWASQATSDPAALSYRLPAWQDIEQWKESALQKVIDCIHPPNIDQPPSPRVLRSYTYDGLLVEELEWQLPYGQPTQAVLLKPAHEKKPLPGVLALHDHGGNKYFGKRKIIRTHDQQHPLLQTHQAQYYGGKAWANELAKRGYVVLIPDNFTFGSRRVLYQDFPQIDWGPLNTKGYSDDHQDDTAQISAYNDWAAHHEHIMAKSLFCTGTTWPGMLLKEDQIALDILCARPDVDAKQIGCSGLSGGGLRTVYLGGLDHRIKCAVSIGFMTTWRDFLLHKSYTHTWMIYIPLLPNFLDFPEVFGIRIPLPTMVLNNRDDQLFTPTEMNRADEILSSIFVKANASEKYQCNFYDGPHKFDVAMQEDAFDWFDRWLK